MTPPSPLAGQAVSGLADESHRPSGAHRRWRAARTALDDVGVAGAAAEIRWTGLSIRASSVMAGILLPACQRGEHQEAGRAEAALQRVVVDEGLLQTMQGAVLGAVQGAVLGQALDRAHVRGHGPARRTSGRRGSRGCHPAARCRRRRRRARTRVWVPVATAFLAQITSTSVRRGFDLQMA